MSHAPSQQQQFAPRAMERNLAEQVNVLEGQLAHYKELMKSTGNGAGQFPATAQKPPPGQCAPQPLAYSTPPLTLNAPTQPHGSYPTAPGVHQATLGYPHGVRHFPVTKEQPNVGAAARFAKLSSEATKTAVRGSGGKQLPSSMPAVETHNTQLMEALQHQQHNADFELSRLHTDLALREAHRTQIETELLNLRRLASESQAEAKKARDELDEMLRRKGSDDAAINAARTKAHDLQQRYDFVSEELSIARRDLEAERKMPKYQPTSAMQAVGGCLSYDPYGPTNDFSSTKLACDNEALRAQVQELVETLTQRDAYLDQLNKTNAALMEENAKIATDMRHAEQKHLVSLSTTESHRVLLQDAQSEVEYLRLLTSEQKATIDRMTRDHEERYDRIRTEMEARQVREMQAQNAVESAKSLHVEASRVHQALIAEQGINEALRAEIASLQRNLSEEQHKNKMLLGQYEQLRIQVQATEGSFSTQTAKLESVLQQWQQQQARQASEERGQLQHANDILKTLKTLELPTKQGSLGPSQSAESCTNTSAISVASPHPVAPSPSGLTVSGTIQLHTTHSSSPNPVLIATSQAIAPAPASSLPSQKTCVTSAYVASLQDEVKDVLQMEQAYRRDAEASRLEALAALAMHNKSLETVSVK